MGDAQARQVRLVGATIAAISGPVVIAALFVHWYIGSPLCADVPCVALVRSGWNSLGTDRLVILAAGILALAPLLAEAAPPASRPWLRGVAGCVGLLAALIVLHRLAGRPPGGGVPVAGFVRQLSSALAPGPWIELVACLGVAGGGLLAGIGPDFFTPARGARIATAVIWTACLVAAVALWMPWVSAPAQFAIDFSPSTAATAWEGLHTLATLLILSLVATAGGAAIAAWFRWRAVFLALAAAGWLLAAFAAVGELRPTTQILALLPTAPAHHYGYWLFLGCAAAIVLTGVAAATSEPQRSSTT